MKQFNLITYGWPNCIQLIIKKTSIRDVEYKFLTPLFISLQEVSTRYINGSKLGWHRYHSVEQNFYSSLCSSSKLILPVCCVHLFISTVTWLNYLKLLPSLNHLKSLLLLINCSKFPLLMINCSKFPLWTDRWIKQGRHLYIIVFLSRIAFSRTSLFIHLVLKGTHQSYFYDYIKLIAAFFQIFITEVGFCCNLIVVQIPSITYSWKGDCIKFYRLNQTKINWNCLSSNWSTEPNCFSRYFQFGFCFFIKNAPC